jgi:hypothetical protein
LSSRRKKWNGDSNGNGNGQTYKIGTCPICKEENVQLSEHHIYKKAVYGESDIKFIMCRRCHDVVEFINRTWENMVLRPFIRCYRETFNSFAKGEINGLKIDVKNKIDEEALIEALMPIVIRGFSRIENKGVNPWLQDRVKNKGIKSKKKKDEN